MKQTINSEDDINDLRKVVKKKQDQIESLEQILRRAVKAIRQNCFIIPKDGDNRDRAIRCAGRYEGSVGAKR